MKNNGKQLLSQRAFAKLAGVSQPYISKLVRQGRIPRHAGGIDEVEGRRALARVAIAPDAPTSFAEAQRRWRLATAQLRELELQQKEGTLIYAADVGQEVERVFANVRARLLAMPVKMAAILANINSVPECAEILRHEIYSALEFLSVHVVDRDFQIPEEAIGSSPERPV